MDGCMDGWGKFEGMDRRTLGVELQDVDVAVCVCDGYVELSFRGEEGYCDHFDGVGGFAEEAELVGFFLYPRGLHQHLSFFRVWCL